MARAAADADGLRSATEPVLARATARAGPPANTTSNPPVARVVAVTRNAPCRASRTTNSTRPVPAFPAKRSGFSVSPSKRANVSSDVEGTVRRLGIPRRTCAARGRSRGAARRPLAARRSRANIMRAMLASGSRQPLRPSTTALPNAHEREPARGATLPGRQGVMATSWAGQGALPWGISCHRSPHGAAQNWALLSDSCAPANAVTAKHSLPKPAGRGSSTTRVAT